MRSCTVQFNLNIEESISSLLFFSKKSSVRLYLALLSSSLYQVKNCFNLIKIYGESEMELLLYSFSHKASIFTTQIGQRREFCEIFRKQDKLQA